ncbi:MAG TPA: tetratricopeptide repeat protein [Chitinophagaceae bacterium]|nr:tetratricopeptide repeat protein [Chitinophagaceae bacterium]
MKIIVLVSALLIAAAAHTQTNPMFANLPVGKYAVGFKIVTFTDDSRVTKPLYNFFGEKETADRYRKISLHIWYPAKPNTGKGLLTYGDYCYNYLLSRTDEQLDTSRIRAQQNSSRNIFQGFFGPINDNDWNKLKAAPLMAQKDATPLKEKFPLLIGTLRPLSTSVTNEMMASNGYVVGMVVNSGGSYPLMYISDVTDMQLAMAWFARSGMTEENTIGAYGFSGSGFSQVLLAMNDPRINALADIESALYGENLWESLSSSNYCNVSRLRIPFLHIYGKELATADKHFHQFHNKKYSDRYHLLLNQPGLHHWDVATEGRASTTVLHIRGDKEPGIRANFALSNIYLLHFFNAVLKNMHASKQLLATKQRAGNYHDSLWSITRYPALAPPPDRDQFAQVINRKGIDTGIAVARHFFKLDPAADFLHENILNALARQYRGQDKRKEGLALMQLAVEFYPDRAWLWNNLADMHEAFGNKEEAIHCSEKVAAMLAGDKGNAQSFNQRILRSSQERLKRLKS